MLGVNLIDHQNRAVALTEIGYLMYLFRAPDPAGRVMRRAEEPQRWTVGFELFFYQIKIKLIAVVLHAQRVSKYLHALALRRHRKRIVDRRVHHHAVTRFAERLNRIVQRGDGAVG